MSTNIDNLAAFVRPPERSIKVNPEFREPVVDRTATVEKIFAQTEAIVRLSDPHIIADAEVHQLPVPEAAADPDIAHLYNAAASTAPVAETSPQLAATNPQAEQTAATAPDMQPAQEPVHDNVAFLHGARHLVDASLPAVSVDIHNYVQAGDGVSAQIVDFPMPADSHTATANQGYDASEYSQGQDAGDPSLAALGYEELTDDAA